MTSPLTTFQTLVLSTSAAGQNVSTIDALTNLLLAAFLADNTAVHRRLIKNDVYMLPYMSRHTSVLQKLFSDSVRTVMLPFTSSTEEYTDGFYYRKEHDGFVDEGLAHLRPVLTTTVSLRGLRSMSDINRFTLEWTGNCECPWELPESLSGQLEAQRLDAGKLAMEHTLTDDEFEVASTAKMIAFEANPMGPWSYSVREKYDTSHPAANLLTYRYTLCMGFESVRTDDILMMDKFRDTLLPFQFHRVCVRPDSTQALGFICNNCDVTALIRCYQNDIILEVFNIKTEGDYASEIHKLQMLITNFVERWNPENQPLKTAPVRRLPLIRGTLEAARRSHAYWKDYFQSYKS